MTVDGPIRPARSIRKHTRRPSQLPTVVDPASRPGVPVRLVRRVMVERHVRSYKIGRYLRTDGHNGDMDVDYDDVPESHAVDLTRAVTPQLPPYGRWAAPAMTADAAREHDTGQRLTLEDLASLPPTATW